MRTEYSERYITMGLKIAYYRKKAGYTQESFADKRLLSTCHTYASEVYRWKHCLKWQMCLVFLPRSFWKTIKVFTPHSTQCTPQGVHLLFNYTIKSPFSTATCTVFLKLFHIILVQLQIRR